MIPTGFHRPRRGEVCAACGKSDWCLISDDGKRCLCKRVASEVRWKDAGYLHGDSTSVLGDTSEWRSYSRHTTNTRFLDLDGILQRYLQDTTTERIVRLSTQLGVTVDSLRRLGAKWSVRYDAWAFPMFNADRKVVGIRYRKEDGDKFSMKGGNEGLFLPSGDPARTIYMPEGPTDTAALLAIGLFAIGRPNNSNGSSMVKSLLVKLRPAELVIVSDRDAAGRDGATRFASALRWTCRIISPPRHKDVREWVNAGATAAAIECVAKSARYTHFARAG